MPVIRRKNVGWIEADGRCKHLGKCFQVCLASCIIACYLITVYFSDWNCSIERPNCTFLAIARLAIVGAPSQVCGALSADSVI